METQVETSRREPEFEKKSMFHFCFEATQNYEAVLTSLEIIGWRAA